MHLQRYRLPCWNWLQLLLTRNSLIWHQNLKRKRIFTTKALQTYSNNTKWVYCFRNKWVWLYVIEDRSNLDKWFIHLHGDNEHETVFTTFEQIQMLPRVNVDIKFSTWCTRTWQGVWVLRLTNNSGCWKHNLLFCSMTWRQRS